jgi:hypothetical protein
MRIDDTLRKHLLRVLEYPQDRRVGLRLAAWLEKQQNSYAVSVRKSYETGHIYYKGYEVASSDTKHPDAVHLVLPLIPHATAVEFVCRCAEHVQPVFVREFSEDDGPRDLIDLARQCLRGEATKTEVRRAWTGLWQRFSPDAVMPSQLEDDWDQAEVEAQYLGVCAARAAANAGLAIQFPASSARWPSAVCEATIEARSAANTSMAISRCRNFGVKPKARLTRSRESVKAEIEWQRQELTSLLR